MQIRFLFVLVVSTIFLASCAAQNESIVARYGDYEIPVSEFERAYEKSVGGMNAAKADSFSNYKNFLDLYVNYKMKLRDAELRNFDSDPELIKEYEDYKTNVGESYLLEKEIINPGITRLYELRKNEVRASHILISTKNLSEEEAYKKAKGIINELKNGSSFDSLAKEYSEDPYTKNSGGDVFYLVAGNILPDLEDVIYSLEVGQVAPEPVKTRFGYHIIKLTEKIKYRPQISARHILASVRDSNGVVDTVKSLEKIKEVQIKLENGEDFAELAKQYSDDKGSGAKGGDLGLFKRRMMVRPFDEAAFKLKVGETSGIIKTDFGYHIINLTGEQGYPSFGEDRENLLKLYKQTRYNTDLANYINSLKEKYGYKLNEGLADYIEGLKDSVMFNKDYFDSQLQKSVGDSLIFSYANTYITFDSLVSYTVNEKIVQAKLINKASIQTAVNKMAEKEMLKKKVSDLDNEDAEFAKLMSDYKNGLFIFKLQEEEIWTKINLDSAKAYGYYEQNKNNYVWPDRVDYSEIFVKDSAKAEGLIAALKSGAEFDSIAVSANENTSLKAKKGKVGIVEAGKDELSKMAYNLHKIGELAGPVKIKGGWSIIKLNAKYPAGPKAFEECKGEVMSALQELESKRLEEEYLQRLNNLYHPEKNYDELKNVFVSAENNND